MVDSKWIIVHSNMCHEPWTINHEQTNIVVFSIYLLLSIMFKIAKSKKRKAESFWTIKINELAKKLLAFSLELLAQKIFRCLYRRCPPLPIPNREVKPARADGTAVKCGRVGRCQILKKPVNNCSWAFLFLDLFNNRRRYPCGRPCRYHGNPRRCAGIGRCQILLRPPKGGKKP